MGHQGSAHLFGDDGFDVTYALKGPGRLTDVLGDGPSRQASVKLATPSASLPLLGEELVFGASLDATLTVHERGRAIAAFEQAPIPGPASVRVAEVVLSAGVKARAELSPASSPWALSVAAAGQAGLSYRHLLPVGEQRTVGDALHDVLAHAAWPTRVALDGLVEGELHVLSVNAGLELGVALSRGFEHDVVWTLVEAFEGTPATLRAHVKGLARAAVGAALADELELSVGRLATVNPGWVRVRLRSKREGTLTFGASMAVQVRYDLGSSLAAVLDRALALEPLRSSLGALRELATALGSGDGWQKAVSALAARRIGELIDEEDWLDRYTSDPRVKRLVDGLASFVDWYGRLDGVVQGFWEHFLASATGGRTEAIRELLERLAALDPETATLGDLLGDGRYRDLVDLVELLSGHALEELVAGSAEAFRQRLAGVRKLALDALRLLDLDHELLATLHGFAERTGVEACVAWIGAHATSVEALTATASSTIQRLVETVCGKALAALDVADVLRLQRWAARVSVLLARRDAWEQKLRQELGRLKGEWGCSVGIEVGRLLRRSALLDLEVDPADTRLRRAVERALAAADVQRLLEALPDEPAGAVAAPATPPFMLRECAFATHRERWASGSWLLGALLGESRRRRVVEATVRVTQDPPTGPGAPWGFHRKAVLAGGFERGVRGSAAVRYECGVWLDLVALGTGNRLEAPYETVARSLRLSVVRHDLVTRVALGEVPATVRLLADLGFAAVDDDARALPDLDGRETSLAIQLSLPERAITAIVEAAGVAAAWNAAYYTAGFRWLAPGLEENESSDVRSNRGAICRTLMRDPAFAADWTRWADVASWAPALAAVRTAEGVPIAPRKPYKQGRWQRDFVPLGGQVGAAGGPGVDGLLAWRPESLARAQAFAGTNPSACMTPGSLVAASERFAALVAATPGVWEEPLLGLWLVLALVTQRAPEALAETTGMATLRWRTRKEDPWQGPALWRIPDAGMRLPERVWRRRRARD
ncbi:MAG: hypothetical protein AB2L07_00225 [Thermoanaerobaculaceae bacterium]